MENLIYLYILTHPTTSADVIYRMWQRNKILREYQRPERLQILGWVREIKQELINQGIRLKLN